MTELAYLHAYLAWEVFLEETFVLYMIGKKVPRRAAPQRYALPPSRQHAKDWVAEGRDHAKWDPSAVASRAQRFFRGGEPYLAVLRGNKNVLDQAKTIRNAIAHESDSAREKFNKVARDSLAGTLPPRLTPGRFLDLTVPASAPPQSFLDFYLEKIEFVASQIVPI